ncbi:MAG: adenylate/guanylate cyclase domain-containing protein [Alphaproteobacteria bacterium]|jgi:adenylate cyclase|nr:adenylate/guanylate cyclase domain-containing protein [Alphaproteobacteria bacterium]
MAETDVKRRLAAILAADVAGYSRLMGDDERATIAILREFRDVFRERIEANGGRVVDMAGDSVLSVFDSAAGAVQAGIETQAELAGRNEELSEERRMLFRIGVNLGDIEEADDGTVYGDGVNVAARLEAMASPGGITVSGSVYDSVRSKLGMGFEYLGEHEAKNIADPVRAYRVLDDGEITVSPRKVPVAAMTGIAALVIAVAGLAGWWLQRGETQEVTEADTGLALPDGPTVVVLPFADADENATNTMFAQGFSQEITRILTRYSEFFVISPETAQVWRD